MAVTEQKKTVHVAVGIVINHHDEVLIAKRPDKSHQGGLWEFPGGKVEANEPVLDALKREFKEEVALTIGQAQPFMEIHHDYGDKQVLLDIWLCREFSGVAQGLESQEVRWVQLLSLPQYQFPEANKEIVKKLLLQ